MYQSIDLSCDYRDIEAGHNVNDFNDTIVVNECSPYPVLHEPVVSQQIQSSLVTPTLKT